MCSICFFSPVFNLLKMTDTYIIYIRKIKWYMYLVVTSYHEAKSDTKLVHNKLHLHFLVRDIFTFSQGQRKGFTWKFRFFLYINFLTKIYCSKTEVWSGLSKKQPSSCNSPTMHSRLVCKDTKTRTILKRKKVCHY